MRKAVPQLMSGVILTGHGGFDKLEYRTDLPVPAVRDDEVLVRVAAAGVNNTDINTRAAWYSRAVTAGTTAEAAAEGYAVGDATDSGWTGQGFGFPRIQGADACGEIVVTGAAVNPNRLGERVLIEPVFAPPPGTDPFRCTYFGSEVDGAFAQYAAVPSAHAHRVGTAHSDVELASFPCAYSAAENMLTRADLRSGESVLITGASGGVGSAAVQLAVRRRASVIAVASREKAEAVRALGAGRVVDRGADIVSELGVESVDVIIDVVGGTQFPAMLEILRRGGRYAVAGAISGPTVSLDLRTLYLKDLRLLGCTVLERSVFPNLVGYIERSEIRALVSKVFPLSAIVDAQREFLTKRHIGKIVLQVSQ